MGQEENTELRDKLENLEDDIQDQQVVTLATDLLFGIGMEGREI